jgi:hypothetical protein
VLCLHGPGYAACYLSFPRIFSNPQCHAPSSRRLQGQGVVCFTGRRCRAVVECIKRQQLSRIYLLPSENTQTVVQRLHGMFSLLFSCFFTKCLNRSRTNHGLIPIRDGRRAQGIQKVQELEQKVQALEQAIKADVSTRQVSESVITHEL